MGKGTLTRSSDGVTDTVLWYMAQERWELAAYVYYGDVYIPEKPDMHRFKVLNGPKIEDYLFSPLPIGVQVRSVFADGWEL